MPDLFPPFIAVLAGAAVAYFGGGVLLRLLRASPRDQGRHAAE